MLGIKSFNPENLKSVHTNRKKNYKNRNDIKVITVVNVLNVTVLKVVSINLFYNRLYLGNSINENTFFI